MQFMVFQPRYQQPGYLASRGISWTPDSGTEVVQGHKKSLAFMLEHKPVGGERLGLAGSKFLPTSVKWAQRKIDSSCRKKVSFIVHTGLRSKMQNCYLIARVFSTCFAPIIP